MRVALVEDNKILLENLKILLSGESGITVTGAYASAEDALAGIRKAKPEILLTDLGLPGMSGVDLIKEVKNKLPDVEIIAHTIYEDRGNVFAALKAGATGYILKGSSPREIIEALHSIHQGGAPMSAKIARKVIMELQDDSLDDEQRLTPREKDIVRQIESGLSYKLIADKFNISPHTVHSHIKKIYEKLQAKDRNEAIHKARKKGII